MIAPSAMFIEAAIDTMKDAQYQADNAVMLQKQKEEYFFAIPQATEESYESYALGLTVARVLLIGMPAAVLNHVSI